MLQKKSFVKKTRGGKVVKVRPVQRAACCCAAVPALLLCADTAAWLLELQVVREHYLRDDIWWVNVQLPQQPQQDCSCCCRCGWQQPR
jgi:hypothetical protein